MVAPPSETLIAPPMSRTLLIAQIAQTAPPVTLPAIPAAPDSAASDPIASMVFVPAEVTDALNRYVTGLDQDVFKIQEDGVDQAITQIAGRDDRADLWVAVGAEVNPEAALEPLLQERLQVPQADDVVRIHGLGQLPPQTPLKAVGAIKRVRNISQRQAILIVTSSATAPHRYTSSQLEDALRNIDISVYVVNISGPDVPPAPDAGAFTDLRSLTELASRTGGKYMTVKSQEEIPDRLAKIVIELRNTYFVGYTPRNAAQEGAYRSLQVLIQQPRGMPTLTVHSRPGYYEPTH